jgi:uncharacterized protein DUF2721
MRMVTPITESPFAVLTLIAAPAVFTNAASVLTLGTGNRLARVVDRTRVIAREMEASAGKDDKTHLWVPHLDRLEKRGTLLLRAMRSFYAAIGFFAAASLVAVLGASLTASEYHLPFRAIAWFSFASGAAGFIALVIGCVFVVHETRLALQSMTEEAQLAKKRSH